MNSGSKGISFTLQLIGAMALGTLVGVALGDKAAPLGEIGKVIIQAVRTFATPLLFFAILYAVMTTRIEGRHARRMLFVAFLNASIALAIGLSLSNFFRVGDRLAPLFASATTASTTPAAGTTAGPTAPATPSAPAATGKTTPPVAPAPKIEFSRFLSTFVPTSVVQPFAENIAVTVILLALLLGFALRSLKNDVSLAPLVASAEGAVRVSLRVTEIILTWIVKLIPIAVFSVVAQTVGRAGVEGLHNLGYYVALGLFGLALHVLIAHHAWLIYLRRSIPEFWRAAREPVIFAVGTNSSLATLPVTLKALDRLKVSRASSTLGACVGTNFNNDGILLYEGMAALMVAQALGHHLSLSAQLTIAFLSMIAAMGIAGVPEAGFISLNVVLTTAGISVDALALLLTVDWVIARGRSVVNVLSDMVVSLAIEGRQASASSQSAR
jgi:DAACS family dicarboxylate/amino acid:cation (Na+ or H+) symporter